MQAVHEIKKQSYRMSAFGGLVHNDFTRPGEWYSMCNLSDRYAPLLAPRCSRQALLTLDGEVSSVLYKNEGYIYATQNGAIYYKKGNRTTLVYKNNAGIPYTFTQIGNRVLCMCSQFEKIGFLYFEEGNIRFQLLNSTFHFQNHLASYYNLFSTTPGHYVSKIFNENGREEKEVTGIEGGQYDAQTADFLNIGFRFCVLEDNGTYLPLKVGHLSGEKEIAAMKASQYYIAAADKKLYRYDVDSKASIPVETPYIAMFLRMGAQQAGGEREEAPPAIFAQGDYMKLNIGRSINLALPYVWTKDGNEDYVYKASDTLDMTLRVLDYKKFAAGESSLWQDTYGWDCYFILDYNASLVEWVIANNFVHDTEHYARRLDVGSSSYLTTLSFSGERITCKDLNIYPAGTKKLYPKTISIDSDFAAITCPLEHNNRIWGVDNAHNEIRASAQGNLKNWNDYRGLVSDSYAVSVGSDGAFTASFALEDTLFFFKEYSYTVLYGTRPSNFSTNTVEGVVGMTEQGAKSLQVIGKSAYFMGNDSRFYRFSHTGMQCISEALGEQVFTPLSSAHGTEKYYLLAQKANGERCLLVYNTLTGVWWCEDADNIQSIFTLRTEAAAISTYRAQQGGTDLYFSDILALEKRPVPTPQPNKINWFCESGILFSDDEYYRYVSDLKICFESEAGARLEVLAKFDEEQAYTPLASFVAQKTHVRSEKIPLKRCACLRLMFRGQGMSKIHSLSFKTTQGSEK